MNCHYYDPHIWLSCKLVSKNRKRAAVHARMKHNEDIKIMVEKMLVLWPNQCSDSTVLPIPIPSVKIE